MLGKANVGAGTSLSFKITTYSEDTDLTNITGSENEIAVLTDISMNNWYIQSNLIDSPFPGDLVILTSQFSAVPVNIIKKGEIEVYPINVQQYDGTDWLEKEGWIWLQGQWHCIKTWLFKDGYNADLWEKNTSVTTSTFSSNSSSSVTIDTTMHLTYGSGGCWSGGYISSKQKIDLTKYTQLKVTVSNGTAGTSNAQVYISSTNTGRISPVATFGLNGVTTKNYSIGSITGEWYIIIVGGSHCNGGGQANYYISKIELIV